MHRVVAYDDFGFRIEVGEYQWYVAAFLAALIYELSTGYETDIHPDI